MVEEQYLNALRLVQTYILRLRRLVICVIDLVVVLVLRAFKIFVHGHHFAVYRGREENAAFYAVKELFVAYAAVLYEDLYIVVYLFVIFAVGVHHAVQLVGDLLYYMRGYFGDVAVVL